LLGTRESTVAKLPERLVILLDLDRVLAREERRALDLAARRGRKLESVPDAIVDEVLAKLTPIFE